MTDSPPTVHLQHRPGGGNEDLIWHCPNCPGDNPDNGENADTCQWCSQKVSISRGHKTDGEQLTEQLA